MNDLTHLLSPITIKNMTLANRCVMPPMGTNLGTRDGSVTDANLAYIQRQAQSGVGLVITEIFGVHPSGTVGLAAYDDRFIPGLKKMADAIHQAGPKAAVQLHHAGREALYQLRKGTAMGPSSIPSLIYGIAPKEMTLEDIQTIIASFGRAAARAREAGFDAVELHGAHGYLLAQFLSEICNQRKDAYGGSFKNRAKFVVEVVREVRKQVGDDFPVLLRISAEEYIKNGYSVEDMQSIVPDLVNAGADVLHASIGTHGSPGGITSAPPEFEEGWNVWRAEKLKAVTDIPIIAVGRFSDPRKADRVIAEGKADMVAFGRQILADPDFLIKAKEGRVEDIRRCLACNQGCIERLMFEPGSSIRCSINPETGQELLYPKHPARESKTVCVIGAGPGGLTAADEAARLGHNVILYEKEAEAGGQIRFAEKAPGKKIYGDWIDWLIRQVQEKGVEIKTRTEFTGEMLDKKSMDVVVVATGGQARFPDVKGLDQPMVCEATQVLGGKILPGRHVVIIGGGLIGMETADFLTGKGSHVTIVEILNHSPVLKASGHGYMLHTRLKEAGCKMLLNTEVESIGKDFVVTVTNGKKDTLSPVDQVILAVGMEPRQVLLKTLEEKGIRHFVVGDAFQPRRIIEATEEGAKAAWDI
jgi:2,4-dienoyl-CoA reductase-like NADH-dependent reductase (Old Yellow Enzyme family)/thioredoxin reductase